jgi:hypothetical protein
LGGRCRPDTVLAVAYDLKVFFTVVGKPPRRVRPVDVLAFMTAQRAGGEGRLQVARAGGGGVSARTLRRLRRRATARRTQRIECQPGARRLGPLPASATAWRCGRYGDMMPTGGVWHG